MYIIRLIVIYIVLQCHQDSTLLRFTMLMVHPSSWSSSAQCLCILVGDRSSLYGRKTRQCSQQQHKLESRAVTNYAAALGDYNTG